MYCDDILLLLDFGGAVHFDPFGNCGRCSWLGKIVAIFSIRMKLELFMPSKERFAGHGFVVWILFLANPSNIAESGFKIDFKSLRPTSRLIAFPLR